MQRQFLSLTMINHTLGNFCPELWLCLNQWPIHWLRIRIKITFYPFVFFSQVVFLKIFNSIQPLMICWIFLILSQVWAIQQLVWKWLEALVKLIQMVFSLQQAQDSEGYSQNHLQWEGESQKLSIHRNFSLNVPQASPHILRKKERREKQARKRKDSSFQMSTYFSGYDIKLLSTRNQIPGSLVKFSFARFCLGHWGIYPPFFFSVPSHQLSNSHSTKNSITV